MHDESLNDSFIFIGGLKKQGNWFWSESERKLNYDICWIPGKSNDLVENGNCMNIYRHSGQPRINDNSCENSFGLFLCEEHGMKTL